MSVQHSVLNVKAVVGTFNQEKARDYEPSDGPSFEALEQIHSSHSSPVLDWGTLIGDYRWKMHWSL